MSKPEHIALFNTTQQKNSPLFLHPLCLFGVVMLRGILSAVLCVFVCVCAFYASRWSFTFGGVDSYGAYCTTVCTTVHH